MRVPRQLLRDTIVVERYAGAGAMGPLYGAPEPLRASFQPTSSIASSADGTTLGVTSMAIIRPEDGPVRPESRVLARGVKYRVVECYAMPDERRPSQYELRLGKFATGYDGPGFGSGSGS